MEHLSISSLPYLRWLAYFQGVLMFFTISGFLITASYDRNKNLRQYLKNRILRIFPALWVSFFLLLSVLFYFQIVSLSDFGNVKFIAWIVGQLSVFQFYTPDMLRDFGVGAPNGSLWTIPVEFVFYLILPLIFVIFRKRLRTGMLICAVLSVAFNFLLYKYGPEGTITKLLWVTVFPYLYNFMIGSLLYIYWDKVRKYIEGKFLIYLSVYLIYCIGLNEYPDFYIASGFTLLTNVMLGLVTISFAYTLPHMGRVLMGYDISYGVYIYHMIVVNVYVQCGFMNDPVYLLQVVAITVLLGIMSWVLVERKALALKYKTFAKPDWIEKLLVKI